MTRVILGLSAFFHDSAAALLIDGRVAAAAHEERGSRRKFDARFPAHAVRTVLAEAGVGPADLDAVVLADKPLLKTDRILMTAMARAPRGGMQFVRAFADRGDARFAVAANVRAHLARALDVPRRQLPPLRFVAHHHAHAAGAFYASPFDQAAVLCLDAVGEWACMSGWHGSDSSLRGLWEQRFPHSPGLLYSAVTRWLGLRVNMDEYKVMGLAAYGQPRFADALLARTVTLYDDGSFRLAPDFVDVLDGRRDAAVLCDVFGRPPAAAPAPGDAHAADVAASVQLVLERIVLGSARALQARTGLTHLCLAGGVALNGKANAELLADGAWDDIWAQSAPGDAGNAVGAALAWWWRDGGSRRPVPDALAGARLGTTVAGPVPDAATVALVAERLAGGDVIGWCHGRAEWGPRALGGRSILADPRDPKMRDRLNARIKRREGYRPFAPVVRACDAAHWFPAVADVSLARWMQAVTTPPPETCAAIPAAVHVDGTARVQILDDPDDPLARLLGAFGERAGVPVLLNTSFNGPDEPIVDTAADARRAAARLGLDALVLEGRLYEPAQFDPPPSVREPRRPSDWLPALAVALVAGVAWPSWRRGAWAVGAAGLVAAALLAAWAGVHPWSLRRARQGLAVAVRAVLAVPARLALALVWLGVVVPAATIARLRGFDPLDLRGDASPRRPPAPQGPVGKPY